MLTQDCPSGSSEYLCMSMYVIKHTHVAKASVVDTRVVCSQKVM